MPWKCPEKAKAYAKLHHGRYRDKDNARSKRWQITLRNLLHENLGEVCNCCGMKGRPFLTLDHINNDGRVDGYKGGRDILLQARDSGWDKTKYQILCYNCNYAKRNNKGTCPHKFVSIDTVNEVPSCGNKDIIELKATCEFSTASSAVSKPGKIQPND